VLPPVFEAQRAVEVVRKRMGGGVNWDSELSEAEEQAISSMGIKSMSEALARAGEVERVKQGARAEVARRKERCVLS
ncbi:MAG: hypothetical protein QF416_08605, partial [Candidatus Marinimicrobia bacterium]|nr:hypothetical protein [Candidatus Neomarinimicrobiota bacterium]